MRRQARARSAKIRRVPELFPERGEVWGYLQDLTKEPSSARDITTV